MPPFAGIPYLSAPPYCFPIAEFSLYGLFVLCLIHASRKGIRHVGYLLGGVLFGLILEWVNVHAKLGYTYGRFMVMFGKPPLDIPLCIGVGWGVIMYTGRIFSDHLRLPLWSAAAVDALLAISVDLGMDAVAYRLHMWHWDWSKQGLDPLTAQWFGVPYANFFGWLMVVFFYSSFSRLLERTFLKADSTARLKLALVPLLAVILSQVCLYAMLVHVDPYLHEHFGIISLHRFAAFLIVLGALTIRGLRARRPAADRLPPAITWLVPLWFHCFFFAWLFLGGFYRESTALLLVSALNFVIALAIHMSMLRRRNSVTRP